MNVHTYYCYCWCCHSCLFFFPIFHYLPLKIQAGKFPRHHSSLDGVAQIMGLTVRQK